MCSALGKRGVGGFVNFGYYMGKRLTQKQTSILESLLNYPAGDVPEGVSVEGFVIVLSDSGSVESATFLLDTSGAVSVYVHGCLPSIELLSEFNITNRVKYRMDNDSELSCIVELLDLLLFSIKDTHPLVNLIRVSYLGSELRVDTSLGLFVFKDGDEFSEDVALAKKGIKVPLDVYYKGVTYRNIERNFGKDVINYDYEGGVRV